MTSDLEVIPSPPFTVDHYGSFGAAIGAENGYLRAFITKLANPDYSKVNSPLGALHAEGICMEAKIVAELAQKALDWKWEPET